MSSRGASIGRSLGTGLGMFLGNRFARRRQEAEDEEERKENEAFLELAQATLFPGSTPGINPDAAVQPMGGGFGSGIPVPGRNQQPNIDFKQFARFGKPGVNLAMSMMKASAEQQRNLAVLPQTQAGVVAQTAALALQTEGKQAALNIIRNAPRVVSPQALQVLSNNIDPNNLEASLQTFSNLIGGQDAQELITKSRFSRGDERFKSQLEREEEQIKQENRQALETQKISAAQEKDRIESIKKDPVKFSDISSLRKEFTALSKPFIQVRDAFSRIEAASENPSAAGDLALVFNFMKLLDPGSVVRESEFANAQNAAGVPDRVRNIFNKIRRGERLGIEQREDFVNQANNLFAKQQEQHNRRIGEFSRIAESSGISPEQVIVDLSSGSRVDPLRISSQQEFDALPTGTRYIDPDTGQMSIKR